MRGIFHSRKRCAIANQFGIFHHTVDTHRRRVKHKLDVANPIEAIHRSRAAVFELRPAEIMAAAQPPPTPPEEADTQEQSAEDKS